MLLLSAPLAKSSGSSLGTSNRLEVERPGFESQLDLQFCFLPSMIVVLIHTCTRKEEHTCTCTVNIYMIVNMFNS